MQVLCVRMYIHTLPDFTIYSNSVWERDHTKVERIIMSQLWLRMVRPWPVPAPMAEQTDPEDIYMCLHAVINILIYLFSCFFFL